MSWIITISFDQQLSVHGYSVAVMSCPCSDLSYELASFICAVLFLCKLNTRQVIIDLEYSGKLCFNCNSVAFLGINLEFKSSLDHTKM